MIKRLIRNEAVLWVTDRVAHVVKIEKNWLGLTKHVLGCTYEDIRDFHWLEKPEKLKAVLEDILTVYELSTYTLTIVLSGSLLLWQVLELPGRTRKEAREAASWSDALANTADTYTYDIYKIRKQSRETNLWLFSAYPAASVEVMLQLLEARDVSVDRVDVLPAWISNRYGGTDGTLYLREKNRTHVLHMQAGYVSVYTYGAADERDLSQEEPYAMSFYPQGEEEPTAPCWKPAYGKRVQQWHLAGPPSVLL